MVNTLKHSDGRWNEERLQRLFDRDTIRNIRKIPCSIGCIEDKLIWSGNSSGGFSVKSAYIMEFWNEEQTTPWWKHVWTANIHEKIKFFLWKLANKGLPTTSNLLERNFVIERSNCIHGCGCVESDNHLFFHCQTARAIWFATSWSIKWDSFEDKSLMEKLTLLSDPKGILPVHRNDKEDFFIYATLVLEQIWWIRNKAIFDNATFSLECTMNRLRIRFEETRNIALKKSVEVSALRLKDSAWRNPPPHCIRINTDAAVKSGASMIGILARNKQKEILVIKAVTCCSDTPEVAEAFDVLQGMKLAKEKGWNYVCCESDARNIVNSINYPDNFKSHWAAEGVVSEIVQLKREFQEAHVVWIPREKNFLAHFVSSWAVKNDMYGVLHLNSLPSSFFFYVSQESGT